MVKNMLSSLKISIFYPQTIFQSSNLDKPCLFSVVHFLLQFLENYLFVLKKKNSRLFFDSYNCIISLIHQNVLSAHTLPKYYHILVDSSSIWIPPAYFLFESLVSLYSLTFQYPKLSPIIRDKSFRTIKGSQNSLLLIFFIKMMNIAWT